MQEIQDETTHGCALATMSGAVDDLHDAGYESGAVVAQHGQIYYALLVADGEVVVVMPYTDLEAAKAKADELHAKLEAAVGADGPLLDVEVN